METSVSVVHARTSQYIACNQQRKYCYSGILTDIYFLGSLAPYLERAWRLFATPAVSRVPRTI